MVALRCEFCDGTLIAKSGDIFECEFCGTKYSSEWMKSKVQEIKGAVSVVGTVNVTGTVKTEGGISKDSYLKRGDFALEESDWKTAEESYQQAFSIDPECGAAYLGFFLAINQCHNLAEMTKNDYMFTCYAESKSYKRALRFADDNTRPELEKFDKEIRKAVEKRAQEQREFEEFLRNERKRLSPIRQSLSPVRNMLTAGYYAAFGINMGGKVYTSRARDLFDYRPLANSLDNIYTVTTGDSSVMLLWSNGTAGVYSSTGKCEGQWENVKAISSSGHHHAMILQSGQVISTDPKSGYSSLSSQGNIDIAAGIDYLVVLRDDGTIEAAGSNDFGECDVSDWTDIVEVKTQPQNRFGLRYKHTIGLQSDGCVVSAGVGLHGECDVSGWTDIVAISAGSHHTVGLTSELRVVAVGDNSHGECNVQNWSDIVAIAAGCGYTLGLKRDGTVISAGDISIGKWKLFDDLNSLEQGMDRVASIRNKMNLLEREITLLRSEKSQLGLLSLVKKRELDAKIESKESQLIDLNIRINRC